MTRKWLVLASIVTAVALAAVTGGCAPKPPVEPELTPTVAPPVIGEAGVLRAGVDLSYPPFAGKDRDQQAGIDVDVAAALAERLGLKLELVDVKPSEIGSALSTGRVDVMLGGTSVEDAIAADVAFAGTYLVDGPAYFSLEATGATVATGTPSFDAADGLGTRRVGVQNESRSFWQLQYEYGEGFAVPYGTLKEAFGALEDRKVDVVVGDAAVGAYLARDVPGALYSGQCGGASPLGVLVAKDASDLEAAVRETLDALTADGVLEAIRVKWLGPIPLLEVD